MLCKMVSLCDPGGRCFRYIILFGLCYMNLSQFFCLELPSGMQGIIIKVYKLTSKEYNLFFSSYTWSEVVMSAIGGFLIDKLIGFRTGYVLFVVITVLGQGIMAAGAFIGSFEVILAGRFITGWGMGTVKSLANVYTALWFKNKEIVFATSIAFCCCRLGAALGLIIPQMVYEHATSLTNRKQNQIGFSFLLSFVVIFSSLLVCIIVVILDFSGSKKLGRPSFKRRGFNIKELKDFSLRYWLWILSSALFFMALYLFVANGQLFFMSKFGYTIKEANIADFLVFVSPVLITPVIGYLVDIIGYNTWWGMTGIVIGMLAHFLFAFVSRDGLFAPYLLSCLFSLAYSFFGTAVFIIPTFIIQEHQLTTAYNLGNIIYSLIFTGCSVIAGSIVDYSGYLWLEIFFFFCLFTIFTILLSLTLLDKFATSPSDKKINKAGWWLRAKINKWKVAKEHQQHNEVLDYLNGEYVMVLPHSDWKLST